MIQIKHAAARSLGGSGSRAGARAPFGVSDSGARRALCEHLSTHGSVCDEALAAIVCGHAKGKR